MTTELCVLDDTKECLMAVRSWTLLICASERGIRIEASRLTDFSFVGLRAVDLVGGNLGVRA